MSTKLWSPTQERINATLLCEFINQANRKHGTNFSSYDDVWEWSISRPDEFWRLVWDFCGVITKNEPGPALKNDGAIIDSEFFPDAKLNFAQNLLRRKGSDPAIIFHGENTARRELSWDELQDSVAKTAQA
ncbi:MAG: acetoacetate--CoA ligase, partial [Rhodospirillaceae bacterium]|nr:acetoacetate--CoA ligase [Rhodospirillaceae bacterium]